MDTPTYKIVVRNIKGRRVTLAGYDCHATKSVAGTLFHATSIQSVKVVGRKTKTVYLRLSKNKNGKVLQHLTINVPSELAVG